MNPQTIKFSRLLQLSLLVAFFLSTYSMPLIAQDIIDSAFLPKKTIIVGGDEAYPPFTYLDSEGTPRGLDVDIMKEVAKIMNLDVEFRFSQWGTAINNLKAGEIDVIMGISYAAERKAYFDYTIPHTIEFHGIFVRKDSGLEDLIDLGEKTIITQQGDVSYVSAFKPYGFDNPVVEVDSIPVAIRMLAEGQHDFVIAPYSTAMEAINELGINNLKVIGPPLIPHIYRFAVKKGNTPLLVVLNDGLDQLKTEHAIEPLQLKWIKYIRKDNSQSYRVYFFYISAALLFIIFLLVIWSRILKKQVKKHSESLIIAKKEAEAANYAKSDFLAKLSHEIRTPLNSVIGNCQILSDVLKDSRGDSNISKYIQNIEASSFSLLDLMNDVLDLSKIEAGKVDVQIEEIEFRNLIENVYNIHKEAALNKGVIFNYAIDPELPLKIRSDKAMLVKIIGNIVSNAIKFTSEGKHIWLKAKNDNGDLLLQVQDEGTGISSENLNLVFTAFEQAVSSGSVEMGAGLGLAIVKENVQVLGGDVFVDSVLGAGSCFNVRLPLSPLIDQDEPE